MELELLATVAEYQQLQSELARARATIDALQAKVVEQHDVLTRIWDARRLEGYMASHGPRGGNGLGTQEAVRRRRLAILRRMGDDWQQIHDIDKSMTGKDDIKHLAAGGLVEQRQVAGMERKRFEYWLSEAGRRELRES